MLCRPAIPGSAGQLANPPDVTPPAKGPHSGARHSAELPMLQNKAARLSAALGPPCFASRSRLELLDNTRRCKISTATQDLTTTWLMRTPTRRSKRPRWMRRPSLTPTPPAATHSRSSLPIARTAQSSSRVSRHPARPSPALLAAAATAQADWMRPCRLENILPATTAAPALVEKQKEVRA